MADVDCLVHEVILAEDFNLEDLRNFSIAQEMARLDTHGTTDSPFSVRDGWKEGSVKIRVPNSKSRYASESAAPEFQVSGIYYRPFLEVIKAAFHRPDVQGYHWVPFKWHHQSPEGEERVYSDIYNSDAMLEEDAKIQALPRNPEDGPDTEVVMGAILLWSDSTHLTSFGSASLWPIYLFFGNVSKYTRGKPSALAAHHLAYVPSVSVRSALGMTVFPYVFELPDTIQDFYLKTYETTATAAVLRFLKVELMQEIWRLLLDEDFVKAYAHGILITCGDGVKRRIFPRFFTYAADYPEK
jgi:hypothetical protein